MLRWLKSSSSSSSSSPSPTQTNSKSQKTEREVTKQEDKSGYEAKRQRRFLPEWKKTYPFIEYDRTTEVMFCKLCRSHPAHAQGNTLFHGVTGDKVRLRNIKEHALTKVHKSSEIAKKEGGSFLSSLEKMDVAIRMKMLKLFNIAYFVAKEEAAFAMFPKLVDLHRTNGLDLGTTYNNDQACRRFVKSIGSCLIEELQEKLRSARFFSIVSDTSVDRSVKDQELIYCTYLQDGKPFNQLVGIVALEHAHSQGILEAILTGLLEVGVGEDDLQKRLVGFGCDGAAVMLGVNNGVAARLQRTHPSLVSIWCVAHRLELAALDSVKLVPQLQDLKHMLRAIHKHYTCSAKASRELEEIGKAMDVSIVRPGNCEGTRWLPHMSQSLVSLMRNYGPIMIHFENHASDSLNREASAAMKGRAKVILQSLKKYTMLLFIHFMLDVLEELKHLSLLFQKEGLTLQMVLDGLQTTKLTFMAMQTNPGSRLKQYLEEIGSGCTWQGVQITRTGDDAEAFSNLKSKIIDQLLGFVSERFKSLETGILKDISTLMDLANWPEDLAALATFGIKELDAFMDHFGPILKPCEAFNSIEAARREWLDLKVLVTQHYRHLDSNMLWQRLIQGSIGRQGQFDHLKVIVEISLVLPMSSSCCERGFSTMKRMKSDWRSSLSNDMLNCLLQISIHGPSPQQYNPERAVKEWWDGGSRSRRPDFSEK